MRLSTLLSLRLGNWGANCVSSMSAHLPVDWGWGGIDLQINTIHGLVEKLQASS